MKKQLFSWLSGSFAVLSLTMGNAQTPLKATILSKWEKAVTPENAWQNYPRPQLVLSLIHI